jgi:glycosyltransferase involved in cell wall biosynthesis
MGWDHTLDFHCGTPPEWAECLPPGEISTIAFLKRCHAMICCNWGTDENWPGVGLEAMSAGVPLVVDDAGGWREMIEIGAGMLRNINQFAPALMRLARDEPLRQEIINAARKRVEILTDPKPITAAWKRLLGNIQC